MIGFRSTDTLSQFGCKEGKRHSREILQRYTMEFTFIYSKWEGSGKGEM